MGPVYLFDLASRHTQWLSVRQSAVAGNIANANTPSFQARDVQPFEEALEHTRLAMAATNPSHLSTSGLGFASAEMQPSETWETTMSGNSVVLEQELMKAGEVNRDFALDNSIVKSFHRMLMSAVRA